MHCKRSQVGDEKRSKEQRQVRYKSGEQGAKQMALLRSFPPLWSSTQGGIGKLRSPPSLGLSCTAHTLRSGQGSLHVLLCTHSAPSGLCSCSPPPCRALLPSEGSTWSQCEFPFFCEGGITPSHDSLSLFRVLLAHSA